jgi:hypothetical protein
MTEPNDGIGTIDHLEGSKLGVLTRNLSTAELVPVLY